MFNHLKLANLQKTNTLAEMADMTKKAPMGIEENILVKIDKILFPSDFMIIDMLGDPNENMILGRPFLATIYTRIDVFDREISLGTGADRIVFYMNGEVHHPTTPIEKVYMANSIQEEESFNPLDIKAVLNEWILDSFDVEANFVGICNNPYSRGLEEYKVMFDNEIEQLANEYELRIEKKGYILHDIWEKCERVHGGTLYSWYDDIFEEEKRCKSGLDEKYYDPLQVCIETFEVKRYSFEEGKSFVCVTKQLEDALPLGWVKESRFKEMIRKEMDMDGSVQREM
ncbi:RNA-directed DNA polymerase, eukaryota, reverse transcriptase zinc-binding domain protein [Tanacetum coccineum]